MCRWVLGYPQFTAPWFFSCVVWVDPCSSIIPGSYMQYVKMKQLLKGEKGWQSDNAKKNNRNRRGPKTALTQTTFEGTKVNWVIILSRGVIGVDILPLDRELDADGMATVVGRLEERLRDMLGADVRLPTILMSDRGTGMHSRRRNGREGWWTQWARSTTAPKTWAVCAGSSQSAWRRVLRRRAPSRATETDPFRISFFMHPN